MFGIFVFNETCTIRSVETAADDFAVSETADRELVWTASDLTARWIWTLARVTHRGLI
jgi:hypothetical protein